MMSATKSSAGNNIIILVHFSFNLACKKNTAWKKHRTGNVRRVAYFNEENLCVLWILGETPTYKGINPDKDDTPIQISTRNVAGNESNALQCSGELVSETSELTKAVNTG